MLPQGAPHSLESDRPQKRPRTCSDKKSTMPLKFSSADVIKRCLAQLVKHHILTGAGEISDADFELFLSYDTLPRRPAWRGISRDDRVKASFTRRGMTICKDTRPDDMIKFKEALMYADMD